MNKKILVICQSQHQLEKALYIQKIVPLRIDIACVNYRANHLFLGLLQNIDSHSSYKTLIPNIHKYEKFLFFSMVPSAQIFSFIQKIRVAEKIIIAVQETHQLGMHVGVVNNLIFTADIIFSASDLEKEYLTQLQPKATIHSIGWLFQNEYHEFISSLHIGNVLVQESKYALVIFAAPTYITTSSEESFQARKDILCFVREIYINLKLLIKLHPLEDKKLFKEYAKQNSIHNLSFSTEDQSLWKLGKNASVIIASDRTQTFIDLATDHQEFILYQLGQENFISSYFNSRLNSQERNNIRFYSLQKTDNHIQLFKKIYCKSEKEAERSFISALNAATGIINKVDPMEMVAWSNIYGMDKGFKLSVNNAESELARNLKKFFGHMGNLDVKRLGEQLHSLSLRTPVILSIMRAIIARNSLREKVLIEFVEVFFDPHIIQYFAIDSIRFELFLQKIGVGHCIQPGSRELLKTTKLILGSKSSFVKNLFALQEIATLGKSRLFKKLTYSILDAMLAAFGYFKN